MRYRWFRYGLIGNILFFGGGFAGIGYAFWLVWDIKENSVKISQELAKQIFDNDLPKEQYIIKKETLNKKSIKKPIVNSKQQGIDYI